MQFSVDSRLLTICLLVGVVSAAPLADIGDYPHQMQQDSYLAAAKLPQNDATESELQLELVPPAVLETAGPHMYYMNSDGIAVPVEVQTPVSRTRRSAAAPASADETLLTDETVIIGPPSGQNPFGTPAVHVGFRPSRAYYARRYHKYPWNYH